MGLDMYLTAELYLSRFDEQGKKTAAALGRFVPKEYKAEGITIQAAYWRKANQIHNWFVNNVQDGKDDCGRYYVPREALDKLVKLAKYVLETKDYEKLPTTSGFFFGSTDYDEYYNEDLKATIEQLEKALKDIPDSWSFYYQSSW